MTADNGISNEAKSMSMEAKTHNPLDEVCTIKPVLTERMYHELAFFGGAAIGCAATCYGEAVLYAAPIVGLGAAELNSDFQKSENPVTAEDSKDSETP